MNIADIVSLIMNNGMGIVLLAYFIYKDNKYNANITSVMGEVKEILVELRTIIKGAGK